MKLHVCAIACALLQEVLDDGVNTERNNETTSYNAWPTTTLLRV